MVQLPPVAKMREPRHAQSKPPHIFEKKSLKIRLQPPFQEEAKDWQHFTFTTVTSDMVAR